MERLPVVPLTVFVVKNGLGFCLSINRDFPTGIQSG
jgi:hypothetical protein